MTSRKRRKILRLEDNEIAVVGSRETWEHLITVYNMLGEDAPEDEKDSWYEAADWIFGFLQESEQEYDLGP